MELQILEQVQPASDLALALVNDQVTQVIDFFSYKLALCRFKFQAHFLEPLNYSAQVLKMFLQAT